jgi:hypothetical protein
LDADIYKESSSKRLTGQVGYSYYPLSLAEKIVKDELLEMGKGGSQKAEFEKLKDIYSYITGRNLDVNLINKDEIVFQLSGRRHKIDLRVK